MLTVIIPSYNDANNIPLAIASASKIKHVTEIIVIDDCSKDNTEKLLRKLEFNNPKISYFKNQINIGSGLSFIKGIQKSLNPYIILLNSDDFFIPNGIENLFNYVLKNNLDVGYGKMAIKKETGIHKYSHPGYKNYSYINQRNELKDLLIFDMYMPSFGTIIKTEGLKEFYNVKYYKKLMHDYGGEFKAHDYDLFINLAKKRKKFGFLNEVVCIWCPKKESQSGENYFNSGESCYESSFLFNKYSKDESFSKKTINQIYKRIRGKYKNKEKYQIKRDKLSFHYKNFLNKINLLLDHNFQKKI
ncbi:MAG: glycosyltransferase family 2 protein, partial [Alphaproteobacteria bacterium]